jgi:2-methylaconitate cis-trans-isomerase PrpF
MSDGIRCMLMRGGTSKGAFFLAMTCPPTRPSAMTC